MQLCLKRMAAGVRSSVRKSTVPRWLIIATLAISLYLMLFFNHAYDEKIKGKGKRFVSEQVAVDSPWKRQLESDLQEYSSTKISKDEFDAALKVTHSIYIKIRNNQIWVRDSPDTWLTSSIMQSIRDKMPHHVFAMFKRGHCAKRLPDTDIALQVEDIARPIIGQKRVPLFCWAKKVGQSGILYPYWQHLIMNTTSTAMLNITEPKWEDKLDLAFFRGSTTGISFHVSLCRNLKITEACFCRCSVHRR